MAGSGHASAFYRYTGVDDFVAVAAREHIPRISKLIFQRKFRCSGQSIKKPLRSAGSGVIANSFN